MFLNVLRSAGVQLLVGGTSRPAEAKRLARGPNTFVVCTVGRFHDHVENTASFQNVLSSVSVVVLDECDRLLEMGFRQEVRLLLLLPPDCMLISCLFGAQYELLAMSQIQRAGRACSRSHVPHALVSTFQAAVIWHFLDMLGKLVVLCVSSKMNVSSSGGFVPCSIHLILTSTNRGP